MADDRLVGAALVVGLAAFIVGAVRWRIVYEGPPDTALPAIHADRRRRAWIHSWMIAGFVAWDRWAGTLYRIHMLTSYLTFALLGAAVLADTDLPTAVGWLGLAWGLAFAAGFAVPGRHQVVFYPPFWALTYPAVVGVRLIAA
jgi:hypothetical protein